MKKVLVLILAACLFGTTALAQSASLPLDEENEFASFDEDVVEYEIWEGMPYRQIKKIYDFHDWQKADNDPYSPWGAGICSFVIPGLGQIINGEVGIGLAYMGGILLSEFSTIVFASLAVATAGDDFSTAFAIGSLASLITAGVLDVCSIFGAYRMAARQNLLFQDLHSSDVSFTPGIAMIPNGDGRSFTPGLSLRVNF